MNMIVKLLLLYITIFAMITQLNAYNDKLNHLVLYITEHFFALHAIDEYLQAIILISTLY